MIVESGIVPIKAGEEAQFEAGFNKNRHVLESAPGFQKVEVRRGVENPSTYLLLVWWNSIEDHIAFTQSETYGVLMGAIGPHTAGIPDVFHYGETI